MERPVRSFIVFDEHHRLRHRAARKDLVPTHELHFEDVLEHGLPQLSGGFGALPGEESVNALLVVREAARFDDGPCEPGGLGERHRRERTIPGVLIAKAIFEALLRRRSVEANSEPEAPRRGSREMVRFDSRVGILAHVSKRLEGFVERVERRPRRLKGGQDVEGAPVRKAEEHRDLTSDGPLDGPTVSEIEGGGRYGRYALPYRNEVFRDQVDDVFLRERHGSRQSGVRSTELFVEPAEEVQEEDGPSARLRLLLGLLEASPPGDAVSISPLTRDSPDHVLYSAAKSKIAVAEGLLELRQRFDSASDEGLPRSLDAL